MPAIKPMLACDIKDLKALRYPFLVSPKLDGIRAINNEGTLQSRSGLDIPNCYAQKMAQESTYFMDGELIDGRSTAPDVFSQTTSTVMSDFNIPVNLRWFVFDDVSLKGKPFSDRYALLEERFKTFAYPPGVELVPHFRVNNLDELLVKEEQLVTGVGYEGLMLRSLTGLYKHGRATWIEHTLLKLKRFIDAEGVVLDTYEQMANTNAATFSPLGKTKRSSAKGGKVGKGVLGGFTVQMADGTTLNVGTGQGLTALQREQLWAERASLVGRVLKFKYQAVGTKDKPRIPIYMGFRDRRDM